jgi:hypothetical protein
MEVKNMPIPLSRVILDKLIVVQLKETSLSFTEPIGSLPCKI